jgi:hypothetical protein
MQTDPVFRKTAYVGNTELGMLDEASALEAQTSRAAVRLTDAFFFGLQPV